MAHWLVKSEPGCWSWDDHRGKGVERWDGVRNHQAAGYLRRMRPGDTVFFYHSQKEKRIVGLLEVVGEPYPDPTDDSGRFPCVDLKARESLPHPVTLAEMKADPRLQDLALFKQSRLSVIPVPDKMWPVICGLGGLPPETP